MVTLFNYGKRIGIGALIGVAAGVTMLGPVLYYFNKNRDQPEIEIKIVDKPAQKSQDSQIEEIVRKDSTIELSKEGYVIQKADEEKGIVGFQYVGEQLFEQLSFKVDSHLPSYLLLIDMDCDKTVDVVLDEAGLWIKETQEFLSKNRHYRKPKNFAKRFVRADKDFQEYRARLKDLINKAEKQWKEGYSK